MYRIFYRQSKTPQAISLKKIHFIFIFLTSTLVLSGCDQMKPHQTTGQIAGGALGAVVGSAFGSGSGKSVAIGAGAILGALMGGSIGKSFDKEDERASVQATERALNYGSPIEWRNVNNGHYGRVVPSRRIMVDNRGRNYRKFTQLVYIDGYPTEVHGVAYQNYNGTWSIASEEDNSW